MSANDSPDDEFRRLVEGLDLDFSALDEADARRARERAAAQADALDEPDPWDEADDEEPAYRRPAPPPPRPADRRRVLGWAGTLGGPAVLVVATVLGLRLPQAVVLGAALIFVAGAVVLVSTLPGYGPSHRDFPDDGAVL